MALSSDPQFGLALQAQSLRDNDPNITERVCDEIKQSVIFRYNWQALLQSAPVAVSATGACYAACFSEAGQRVTLNPPASGHFKYLEHRSLSANLLACGDRGRFAFLEAETGLAFVKDVSTRAENKVVDIIECIADPDPQASQNLLRRQMDQLKLMADDCHSKVSAIDQKFEEWLHYTSDLHTTCVETDTSVSDKIHETAIDKMVKETQLEHSSQTMVKAKAKSEQLGKSLKQASEAFKKASDEFPTGWDIMGQQIVGSIADCAVSSVNTFVQAVSNPHLKVMAVTSAISGAFHPRKDSHIAGSDDGDDAPPKPRRRKARKDSPAVEVDDPAYDLVQRYMIDLNILQALLHNGPDGGVDWESAIGIANGRNSIRYVSSALKQHLKDCPKDGTEGSPSATLLEILESCTTIADAVDDESKNGCKMGRTSPLASSDVVKDWQSRYAVQYDSAQTMDAFARGRPGTTTGIPLMAAQYDSESYIAKTNARSAQAQATLEAAKYRLNVTQGVFVSSQENYSKASQDMLDQEMKMSEIQTTLSELSKKNMGLQEAKVVLEKSMVLIVKVKSSIMDLCRFFKAMSLTIEAIVKYSVQPFLEDIAAGTPGSTSSGKSIARIGDYTFTDLQRTLLYQSAITVKANFSVFGDIAAMWCELSESYVMPGVRMLDQLSLQQVDEYARQRQVRDLQIWAEGSMTGVKLIAERSQRDMIDSMRNRVEGIQSVTRHLPPSTSMKQAIETGMQGSREVATESITAAPATNLLNRFAPKRK